MTSGGWAREPTLENTSRVTDGQQVVAFESYPAAGEPAGIFSKPLPFLARHLISLRPWWGTR
jgi:hypothetical protein